MTLIPVEYHGIHSTGPEQFSCILLRWAEQNRILPIWISPLAADELDARDEGYTSRRPSSQDLMIEMISRLTPGVSSINVISHFEGVFIASVVFNNGEEIDARPTDAIKLARALDLEIKVEEDVLQQASFYVSDDVLEEYFDLRFDQEESATEEEVSASGDAQADADFGEMMRSLGMTESDFFKTGGNTSDNGEDSAGEPEENDEN